MNRAMVAGPADEGIVAAKPLQPILAGEPADAVVASRHATPAKARGRQVGCGAPYDVTAVAPGVGLAGPGCRAPCFLEIQDVMQTRAAPGRVNLHPATSPAAPDFQEKQAVGNRDRDGPRLARLSIRAATKAAVMVPAEHEEIEMMARVIREYLTTHPHAADTVDGILTWWLARDYYLRYRKIIEQALDKLIEDGFIEKAENVDGDIVFSIIN